jgi:hypothetical protein
MGGEKMTLVASRITKFLALIAFIVIYIAFYEAYGSVYYMLITGSTLVLLIGLLMCLSIIRRMPFFSVCNARFWSQSHIYLGILALVIFILHVDRSWPHGIFNTILFVFFLLMIFTGFLGLYLFRSVPKKLIFFGPEMLFDQMPGRYEALRLEAESAMKAALEQSDCQELKDFYLKHLYDYFKKPNNTKLFMCGINNDDKEQYIRELESSIRYANQAETASIEKLVLLIRQKYDLDYCYAQKLLLKRWLYVHIPIAYLLIAFVIIHVVLVSIHFIS